MKLLLALSCVALALSELNSYAQVTGKIGTVSIATKNGDYPVVSYAYQIKTTEKRIKRPCLSFYIVVAHPDTTRSTHYATYNPSWRWDQSERSKREPEVDASTVMNVHGKTSGSPFFPDYVFSEKDKILVLRVELWHDGKMLDAYMSKKEDDLTKLGIAADWYRKNL